MFDTLATSIGLIKTAQLRALAVTAATRSEVLPDTPTVGEFVRFVELGSAPMPMTVVDFAKFIDAETDKWAKVIKFAGITPL